MCVCIYECMYVTTINNKKGHEFEREKGDYMGGFEVIKGKEEMV